MRYIASCPSCGHRLSRRTIFARWQDTLRTACPGCQQQLRSVRIVDYFWSFALSTPFGVLAVLAGCDYIAWPFVVLGLLFAVLATYLLNPYITKVELVHRETTDENAA